MLVVTELNFAQSARAPFSHVTLCQTPETTPYWFLATVGNIVPIFFRCWGECCGALLPRSSWNFHLGVDDDWHFIFWAELFILLLTHLSSNVIFTSSKARHPPLHIFIPQPAEIWITSVWGATHQRIALQHRQRSKKKKSSRYLLNSWDFNLWWETAARYLARTECN